MGHFVHNNINIDVYISEPMIAEQVQRVKHSFANPVHIGNTYLNLCIVDSVKFLDNTSYYKTHYDNMILILLREHQHLEKEFLSKGIKFIIHYIFLDIELLNILQLIDKSHDLALNNKILETIYDAAHHSIVLTDAKGQIVYANNYFVNLTGYDFESLIGNMPKLLKSGFHDADFYAQLWDDISCGKTWHGFFVNKQKNGTLFYEEATITPIFTPQGNIKNYLKISNSVAKERLHQNILDGEWRIAKDVLNRMLPKRTKTKDLTFDLRFRAYNHLGGDFILYKRINDERYVIALIDVMGHGIASMIIGLQALAQLDTRLEFEPMLNVVQALNHYLSNQNKEEESLSYLSGIFMELDFNSREVNYISAGHPDFYLVTKDNQLQPFESNNLLIGINENYPFRQNQLIFENIRHIFMYSDGILEIDRSKIDQGDEIMRKVLIEALECNHDILKHVLDTLLNPNFQEDDISMCLITLNDVS